MKVSTFLSAGIWSVRTVGRQGFHTSLDFCTGARDAREFSHSIWAYLLGVLCRAKDAWELSRSPTRASKYIGSTMGSAFSKVAVVSLGFNRVDVGSLKAHAR